MITITCGSTVLTLKNPEIEESIQINFNTAQSSSGDIVKVFKDSGWKTIKTYSYEFVGLKNSEIVDFLYFLDRYSGKLMTLVDSENNIIIGTIQFQNINTVELVGNVNQLTFTFEEE